MEVKETGLIGCYILKPQIFADSRGHFFESFNETVFQEKIGRKVHFVQDNQSYSSYGVVRGLHAQTGTFAQAKLVRVIKGEVLDVAVDVRPQSATYGKHIAVNLSAENGLQLFIPRGFLHGFVVVSNNAEFFYKCDNYYSKESEAGFRFDSPALEIDWLIPRNEQIVSPRDLELPIFSNR